MDILRGVAFGTSITLTSIFVRAYCGTIDGPRNVPFQPPPWVFGVVWPILYVTTGISWVLTQRDIPYSILSALCCSWLVSYVCLRRKRLSALILCSTTLLATTTSIALFRVQQTGSLLLVPLAVWTAFASYINVYDVLGAGGRP